MIKKIVIGALSLIVLIGLYFGITKIPDKPKEEVPKSNVETYQIFKCESDSISRINVINDDLSFTLKKENDKWMTPLPNVELTQSSVSSAIYSVSSITSSNKIDNANLEDYGFSGKEIEIFSDGKITKIIFGGFSPDGSYVYAMSENDNTVYMVSKYLYDSMFSGLAKFRDTTLASVNQENIEKLQIKTPANTIAIEKNETVEELGSAWKMTSPIVYNVNDTVFSEKILQNIKFTIVEFADDNPSDLSKYGLSNPVYTLKFELKDSDPVEVFLGNEDNGLIYAKLPNKANVYKISIDDVSYKDINYETLIYSLIYIKNISNVKKITVEDEKTYAFLINHDGDSYSATVNGVEHSKEEFVKLYQQMIGFTADGVAKDATSQNKVLKMTFEFVDSDKSDVVEFFEYDPRSYSVSVNGTTQFYVSRKQVENLINSINETGWF